MRDVAYIALGSNLGDRERFLSMAREEIALLPGTTVLATTPSEETEPFGPTGQGRYLNQMVAVDTDLEWFLDGEVVLHASDRSLLPLLD